MKKLNKKIVTVILVIVAVSVIFFSSKAINFGMLTPNYTVEGGNGFAYTAYNSLNNVVASGADGSTVVNSVISQMSSGQVLLLSGTFNVASQIIVDKQIIIDISEATIYATVPTSSLGAFSIVTGADGTEILGGHTYNLATKTETGPENNGGHIIGDKTDAVAIRVNAPNCKIDGVDITGFIEGGGVIFLSWASSYVTVSNCIIHDVQDRINVQNGGHNTFENIYFGYTYGGFVVGKTAEYNIIRGCFFDHPNANVGRQCIYLDGSDAGGHNEVYNNEFCNQVGQAALQIKTHFNKVYGNYFHDYDSNAVIFSVYSQYTPSYACDNEFYNNTFENIYQVFWFGHGEPTEQPTQRNKVYSNTFINVNCPFRLQPWNCISTVDDTWIYYNKFTSCPNIFLPSTTAYSTITNTVIAYNEFDMPVPLTDVGIIQSYTNTMIYGNGEELADYNVPGTLQVSAPSGYIGATPIPTQTNVTVTSYTVTIMETSNGTTSQASGAYTVDSGSVFTLTATPNSGYRFDYWLMDAEYSTSNPLSITVTKDLSITPIFSLITSSPTPPPENATNITSDFNYSNLIIPTSIIIAILLVFILTRRRNKK